jgi:hypothetical protein
MSMRGLPTCIMEISLTSWRLALGLLEGES